MGEIINIKDLLFNDKDFLSVIQKVSNKDRDQIINFFLSDVKKYVESLDILTKNYNKIGKISKNLENKFFLDR